MNTAVIVLTTVIAAGLCWPMSRVANGRRDSGRKNAARQPRQVGFSGGSTEFTTTSNNKMREA